MAGLIAHEWFEPHGGSENVAEALAECFPTAHIACLWNDAPERLHGRVVIESRLARGALRRHKALALPAMSRTWRRMPTENYEWVLASSHAFAHHIGSDRGQRERPTFIYTHSPARYLWSPDLDPRGSSLVGRAGRTPLRRLDRRHAGGAAYAANSAFVAERIKRAWGLDATVIFPPVNVERFQALRTADPQQLATDDVMPERPTEYVLAASRFVSYKALDRAIAFAAAAGVPIVVAGSGPDEPRLRAFAQTVQVPVHFVPRPSDGVLHRLMREATAFVFPAVEDFGIMPVEAMALGTPVIVNTRGGCLESVGVTRGGVQHDFSAVGGEENALTSAAGLDMEESSGRTTAFSEASFAERIRNWTKF